MAPWPLRLVLGTSGRSNPFSILHTLPFKLKKPLPGTPIKMPQSTANKIQLTAHWEVLGCALCLLTAIAIPRTGPVWGRGLCPGSRRPRARVPLVVWASPGPCSPLVFHSAICDCLSLNGCFSLKHPSFSGAGQHSPLIPYAYHLSHRVLNTELAR